jgi:NAD(P)-dependent dehydrogenase (short-subunit alcohol dehydrogenase family)
VYHHRHSRWQGYLQGWISRPQTFEEITEQDWDEVLTANLKSCFLITQAVLPEMRAHRN